MKYSTAALIRAAIAGVLAASGAATAGANGEPETRELRPNTGREERSGGYTPGKNSSDLNTPSGLRAPAPSRARQFLAELERDHPDMLKAFIAANGAVQ